MNKIISAELIEAKILEIRGKKVMLDRNLALLYRVKSIALKQKIKRNLARFPEDFMFKLTNEEVNVMVSQNVIPSLRNLGGYLPYAFTEQGIAMLSSVLHSKRAVQVNVEIMRTFVKLRRILDNHRELSKK